MAQCRLAKTDSLSEALAIKESISDITRIGLVKIVAVVVLLFIISFIITYILTLIATHGGFIGFIGDILLGIFEVYFVFVTARATGLLYSGV